MRATTLTSDSTVKFMIIIQPGSGRFEICEGTSTLVTGLVKNAENYSLTAFENKESRKSEILTNRDFYKELRLRGYHYNGLFRSVVEASGDGLYGKIKWDANWIAFLDCLLQIQILGRDTRSLILPTSIQKMVVDPQKHLKLVEELGNEAIFHVELSPELKILRSGGVEIVNLQANVVGRRRPPGIPVLENYKFIPYHHSLNLDITEVARVIVQVALENILITSIKAVEVDDVQRKSILPEIRDALGDLPLVTSELNCLTSRTSEDEGITFENGKLSSHTGCCFIISSYCINNHDVFKKAAESFGKKGFFICREKRDFNLNEIDLPTCYNLICSFNTSEETILVVQYTKQPMHQKLSWIKISEHDSKYSWIEEVKNKMKDGQIVLVAENEPCSGLIGLVNCLRKEPNGSNVRCVFIDDPAAPKFSLDDPFYSNQLKAEMAINILKNGNWGSYRHLQIKQSSVTKPSTDHCYVNSLVKSDLSSLKWISGPFNYAKPKGELVKVQYSALNFRDVMLATGKLSADVFAENRLEHECVLGIEYSGVTESGKRVMGMTLSAAMATHVEADNVFNFTCPDNWTLAEAVTVPCVYGTVYAAYFLSARIEKGKSILIHAGSGGVGLAAIRVAFAYGLEVFTTVSTEEKKQFLLSEYPELKQENIGNSRDTSFEKMILLRTKGKGVDYVLNSLSEEKLQASLRCLGRGGKFLEIGKFDMANDTKIGLSCFLNELSFHAIMVDKLFKAPQKEKLVNQIF